MSFLETIRRAKSFLAEQGRVSLRALQREFGLDDTALDELVEELVDVQQIAAREGKILSWIGAVPDGASGPAREGGAFSASPVEPGLPQKVGAERRQLTVMFCDLVASTALAERLDPEDFLEVMRSYQAVVRQCVEGYEGHVAQYLGDGVLVYFGYPRAHEDDARRAVVSGLEIVRGLALLSQELEREQGVQVQCRIGLHTGPVVAGGVVGGAEQLALGSTPNVAARAQGEAAGGEVLLTGASYALVERYVECAPLGARRLKGLSQPVTLYRALRPVPEQRSVGGASGVQLTPFVGRERELETLLARFEQARAGRGQVVLVEGEAGMGKSRLLHELRVRVEDALETWIDFRCSPYHGSSAFYPIIGYVERALGFEPADDAARKLARLDEGLAAIGRPDGAPLLAGMLSLPTDGYAREPSNAERDRKKTLELLGGLVRHRAAQGPVVLSVEDLHWADPSTLEFLTAFVEQIADARVLVIIASRPDLPAGWRPETSCTVIVLPRLNEDDAERIVDATTRLPPAVRRELVARTDGVPLFVEELTRTLLASGLVREGGGDPVGRDLGQLIPNTLRDSLMAQLDALGPAKEVAQLAAVLGRVFRYEILDAVCTLEGDVLRERLTRIVDSGLLHAAGLSTDATFEFKHALVQDTAYDSLLRSRRRELHDRVASVLQQRFSAEMESEPETLARHCEAAGRKAEAVGFYRAVGERAAARSASVEAVGGFRRALGLLAELDEGPDRDARELQLLNKLSGILTAHSGYSAPELPAMYDRMRALMVALGQGDDLMSLVTTWGFHAARGDRRESLEWAGEVRRVSTRVTEPVQKAIAGFVEGSTAFYAGDQARAVASLDETLELLGDALPSSLSGLGGTVFLAQLIRGWALALAGFPERAWSTVSAAHEHAEAIGDPFAVVQALGHLAAVAQDLGRDPAEIRAISERLVEVASEYELGSYVPFAHTFHGWARAMAGEEDGFAEMRDAIQASTDRGDLNSIGHSLAMLAGALLERDRIGEARVVVEASLEACSVHLGSYATAEAQRVQGELCWKQGDREAAKSCFEQALQTARDQSAKLLELRAATALTRLMEETGQPEPAAASLRSVYEWFTEGSESRYLREAKAVLDRLGDGATR